MKITDVRATCLALPYQRPETWADGRRAGVNNVLVEIETDGGFVGLGEATCGSGNSANPTREVIEACKSILVGENPLLINRHIERFYHLARWRLWQTFANTALAAIEMALWDIAGKTYAQPVCNLLGGPLRQRIPVFGYIMHDSPTAMAKVAKDMAAEGFSVLYFKVGLSKKEDLETVEAVRAAVGPAVRLRVDANEMWDRAEALRRIEALSPYSLDFIEQPLPGFDLGGMADLRARTRVPIAANQSCWTTEDVLRVVRAEAADVMVAGLHWLGGITAMLKAGAICQAANIRFCRHSSGEMGVAAAAGFHAMSTMTSIDDGNQTYYSHWVHDIVRDNVMDIVEGAQPVPVGPGLGVELDDLKVKEFSDLYARNGPFVTEL